MGKSPLNSRCDVLIISPPLSLPTLDATYPAPFMLANYLRRNGVNTGVWDLNRNILPLLISDAVIDHELERLQTLLREDINRHPEAEEEHPRHCQAAAYEAWLFLLKRNRDSFLENLESRPLPFGPRALSVLLTPLLARYVPFAAGEWPIPQPHEVETTLKTPTVLHFRRMIRDSVSAKLGTFPPVLAGISIPFSTQFVASLAVAQEIKAQAPDTTVCVGGPVVTLLTEPLLNRCVELNIIDAFVRHDGEEALVSLYEKLARPARRDSRNGTTTLARGDTSMRAARGGGPVKSPAKRLCFSPLPAHMAGSGLPVPVVQSAGCYWGQCSFCDYVNLHCGKKYSYVPAGAVVDEIAAHAAAGNRNFRLIAEAIPPRHALALAGEIQRRRLAVTWFSYLRVDRRFDSATLKKMCDSGCRYATLGLESSVDRLLERLRKGYGFDDIRRLYDNCRTSGFGFGQVNIIYDIPTSTYEEALSVYKFCHENRDVAPHIQVFQFQLSATSQMAREPERYGIRVLAGPGVRNGGLLASVLPFEEAGGMSREEKAHIFELFQQDENATIDRHAYGGLLPLITNAARIEELDGYSFQFVDRLRFQEATIRLNRQPPPSQSSTSLVYLRESHEAYEISPQALQLLLLFEGRKMDVRQVAEEAANAFGLAGGSRVAVEMIRLCASARLFEWCSNRPDGIARYAAPNYFPRWYAEEKA